MAAIALEGVTRVFGDGTPGLSSLSLAVGDGELMTITGPSGAGKTTTLRVVAGLDPVTAGTVRIGGRVVNDVPARERDVALVTQESALYPHLTVGGNLGFPLRLRGVPRAEAALRTGVEARVHGLQGLLDRMPRVLSTGQRQRTALARATTRVPRALLLDEPLSSLDAGQRAGARVELARFHRAGDVTMLYVTNDQVEALALGERVAVLRDGRLEQLGTPAELLDTPRNRFVAGFVGVPAMGFVGATLEADPAGGGRGWYRVGDQRLRIPAALPGPLRAWVGRRLDLGVRPHHLADAAADPHADAAADRRLTGRVTRVEPHGPTDLAHVSVPGVAAGSTATGAVLTARFAPRTAPPVGAPVELTVDVARLPAFDPVTGDAVWHGR